MQENEIQPAIPTLSGYSDAELDQAFAVVADEVEKSAAVLRSADDKEQFRLAWLGRKQGRLKAISDAWLKSAPPEAKRLIGQRFNALKAEIESLRQRYPRRPLPRGLLVPPEPPEPPALAQQLGLAI